MSMQMLPIINFLTLLIIKKLKTFFCHLLQLKCFSHNQCFFNSKLLCCCVFYCAWFYLQNWVGSILLSPMQNNLVHKLKNKWSCPNHRLLFVHRSAARWWWRCSCTFWPQTTTGSWSRVSTSTASSSWPSSQIGSICGDLLWLDGVSSASFTFSFHVHDCSWLAC